MSFARPIGLSYKKSKGGPRLAAPEELPTARVSALRQPPGSSTIVLVIGGPIARADVPRLCERAHALLEASDADLAVCDVGGLADPDAVTVDALARLQLTARRLGLQIRVRHAGGELRDLLALMGLCEVVPLCADLPLEAGRQTEEREEGGGVEEEGDPGDATG
jgi:ABC-type transporter Mla MlaB component